MKGRSPTPPHIYKMLMMMTYPLLQIPRGKHFTTFISEQRRFSHKLTFAHHLHRLACLTVLEYQLTTVIALPRCLIGSRTGDHGPQVQVQSELRVAIAQLTGQDWTLDVGVRSKDQVLHVLQVRRKDQVLHVLWVRHRDQVPRYQMQTDQTLLECIQTQHPSKR